ncbi:unnamed protein product [Rotaria sp. Silwood1]|nr:unnamed protein product [Rotaria sp. Silwood1]CAF4674830.1 unnamed protein product [Rotaria sp. Silwood1]
MSQWPTPFYDELIVPLLHRMPNLEKLALYIAVEQITFLDGNNLKKDIINYLPRLNKFIFNVRLFDPLPNLTHLLSNEEIQHSFTGLEDNQVICYVDYFIKRRSAQCHFYSYPYTLRYYDNITNSFRGGLFKCVNQVSLFDDRPFEHEFFIRIAQSFPLMKDLSVINLTGQQKANDNNEHFSIIEYLHLNELNLSDVDDDYVEQFLINTKTCLLNNVRLYVTYQSLKSVTHNFTRDSTRVNCAKVGVLYVCGNFEILERLSKYFPHTEILRFM